MWSASTINASTPCKRSTSCSAEWSWMGTCAFHGSIERSPSERSRSMPGPASGASERMVSIGPEVYPACLQRQLECDHAAQRAQRALADRVREGVLEIVAERFELE